MARPHVAIIGGGLTGLSAAFHISRALPQARITLLEKSPRLGGWVRSERVQVEDTQGNSASVVLEAGPRTLRPNAQSVLELIHLLELKDETITTPKSSLAAKSRFLHIPPRRGLLPLPHSLISLCTSPLAPLLFRAILTDLFRKPSRPQLDLSTSALSKASFPDRRSWSDDKITDETFHSFLSRRFGDAFATKFGSALVHGIYATDSRRLSVQAAFPSLWKLEEKGKGRVALGVTREIRDSILKRKEIDRKESGSEKVERATKDTISAGPTVSGSSSLASTSDATSSQSWAWEVGMSPHDPLEKSWAEKIKGAAILSFRDGMETLTRKLVKRLGEREGVEIRVGDKGQVKAIKFDDTGKLEVGTRVSCISEGSDTLSDACSSATIAPPFSKSSRILLLVLTMRVRLILTHNSLPSSIAHCRVHHRF
ncbi:FAD/NAD-P-binding domain-containing protein [Stereum hirsutum FP-91666 SS1]|uniref:FAD/NAD-P-binding domain-containing protein n=1 Tax=Stereum hirsutum (strain FP-91666) TaxID=721885 RepID=UPI000440CBA2|nr:FAD/NAD-P-binding domain-containing protein [Stereum hirsutum FP-91666 SS1]EIM88904.1 FAD/NAD-P-binding domain-containing protein [Stereum hirsutum FP-91666 SS1]